MPTTGVRPPLDTIPDDISDRGLRERIDAAYRATGNRLGWRFLYSPAAVLTGARVALVGLNPGGRFNQDDHGEFAMPPGRSAYRDEQWKGRPPGCEALQVQVLGLFARLGVEPEKVLAGNLVPFRSPAYPALEDRAFSMAFGKQLWKHVLGRAKPRLVVTMGKQATEAVAEILDVRDRQSVPVCWGDMVAVKSRFGSDGTLVGLPHLSQFRIINRPESSNALAALFDDHRIHEA